MLLVRLVGLLVGLLAGLAVVTLVGAVGVVTLGLEVTLFSEFCVWLSKMCPMIGGLLPERTFLLSTTGTPKSSGQLSSQYPQ